MDRDLRVTAGTLLAAWPDLRDPNFMHSVVLICQHNEEGAYGLVTNRLTEYTTRDLLPDHPLLGALRIPIYLGGPVDHTSLQILHRVPQRIPGGVSLDGRIWLGGDLDAVATFFAEEEENTDQEVRVFLGYSGWGAGQLDAELDTGSWLPAPPDHQAIFGAPGEPTWRRVVRSVGGDASDLENLPPDVSWN